MCVHVSEAHYLSFVLFVMKKKAHYGWKRLSEAENYGVLRHRYLIKEIMCQSERERECEKEKKMTQAQSRNILYSL